MPIEQSSQSSEPDRFRSLCAELEEYEHLPELTPGNRPQLITEQSHEDTIDESILAGLTQP